MSGCILDAMKEGQKGDSVNPDLAKFYDNMEAYLKAHGQQLSGDVDWGMIGQYLDHLAANSPAEFEALIKRLPDETKLTWAEKNMAKSLSPEQRRALANRRLDDPNLTDKIDRENWEKSGELSQLQDGHSPYHEEGAGLHAGEGSSGSGKKGEESSFDMKGENEENGIGRLESNRNDPVDDTGSKNILSESTSKPERKPWPDNVSEAALANQSEPIHIAPDGVTKHMGLVPDEEKALNKLATNIEKQ